MKKRYLLLAGFVLVKFFLQYFLISPEYDLHRDEFLHLDQAHHLAWGYLSVPPVTSWISFLIYLLGNSAFWVKFFPALFGALTIIVVWKATEELKGNVYALAVSATCILFSALLATNTLYQPNSLDVLSWTAFYYFVIRYLKTENPKWLYWAAVVFAAGFLNKYNIVFSVIGFLPAILLTSHRKVFVKRDIYIAIGIVLALIFPNLLWQYKHNFPVFHHLNELADTQLAHVNRLDFLKSQVLYFFGSLPVIISAIFALLYYKPFEKYKPFFWSFILTLTVFLLFRAKGYYAMGLYPVYISYGAVFLEDILKNGWKRYVRPILFILPVLFFMMMYSFTFPNKSPEHIVNHPEKYSKFGMLRWEDGTDHALPQDFADMLGWKELASKVDSIYAELPRPDNTLILCDNYGQAGAINYYTKNKKLTACSFHADYADWLPSDKKITDVVLIKQSAFDDDRDRKSEIPLFDDVYLADRRINRYAREDTISIYVLRGAKVDVTQLMHVLQGETEFMFDIQR